MRITRVTPIDNHNWCVAFADHTSEIYDSLSLLEMIGEEEYHRISSRAMYGVWYNMA